MYLAVKRVCESKAWVWQHSAAFADAFADFCGCVENLVRLQPGLAVFRSVRRGIAVEVKVADTILTTEMDELIEKFEPVRNLKLLDAHIIWHTSTEEPFRAGSSQQSIHWNGQRNYHA